MTPPIPTKFHDGEKNALDQLKRESGLSVSEIIRRCVRYLAEEARRKPGWNWVRDTAEALDWPPADTAPLAGELARKLAKHGDDGTRTAAKRARKSG